MNETARILLAEDEAVTTLIIEDLLEPQGVSVTACADGRSAWERLQAAGGGFDAILLDRGLPHLDGMELLRRIKHERGLAHIPVIMETAMADQDAIREGLTQGAYYYLTKPFQPEILLAVVKAAVRQSRELRQMLDSLRRAERPLDLLHDGTFRFRNLEECALLAGYLATACPQPARVVQGLKELLINAVEHGNLGISYAEKGALVLADAWQEDVERRLGSARYGARYAQVRVQRGAQALTFTVSDQGEGFAWSDYLEFSSERAFDPHGRGIAMARKLSFDELEYQGSGNTVTATVKLAANAAGERDGRERTLTY